jgi:hypothetical protein
MKLANLTKLPLILMVGLCSCRNTSIPFTQSGNWVMQNPFAGSNRSEPVTFTIGNFAYVAGGWDGVNRYNDMWQLDPTGMGTWTQMASMPDSNRQGGSTARSSAVGFSVNGEGYLGTGYDGFNYINDFWQFDPVADVFTQKADFGGGPRFEAVGFGIGNYGYITTGFDGINPLKDFWRYDPSSDSWTVKFGFGGEKRYAAVAFVRANRAYVVTGVDNGTAVSDFWRFDPSLPDSSSWWELNHITNFSTDKFDDSYNTITRWNGAAIVIPGTDTSTDRAFVSTGDNGSLVDYTWEYYFTSDLWYEKTPYQGAVRTGAIGISVQNRGFIGLGRNTVGALNDVWEFLPDEVQNLTVQ